MSGGPPIPIGVTLRNMGPQSSRETLRACAHHAEQAGVDAVWITDHIAIPPDDAEGSGGRYLDPLTTLAWLGGVTERIGLGTGVLILPYRRPLPTAKAVATVQELTDGRLRLGVGIGWMEPEFRAVGQARRDRGRASDEALALLDRCFAADEVEANGQPFLFKPRPPKPPVYVGGGPPHALERAARHGDGWMPMGGDPEKLAPAIRELHQRFAEAGRTGAEVVLMTRLPVEDEAAAHDQLARLADAGVTTLVQAVRYDTADDYRRQVELLAPLLG